MILNIIAGVIMLRSIWISVFVWKMYATKTEKRNVDFLAALFLSAPDFFIIYFIVGTFKNGGF